MDSKNNKTRISICLEKQAELMSMVNDKDAPSQCKKMFEEVAMEKYSSPLTKTAAKETFAKSVICSLLYDDSETAQSLLNKYLNIDPDMEDSVIHNLLKSTINAIETKNINMFQEGLRKYKSLQQMDTWMVYMYMKIKEKIDKDVIDDNMIDVDLR